MEDQVDHSCFVPGISVSFQKSYLYYTNWISPVAMLLSVWCFVSNASVIIALFRSGIRSVRPGLLIVFSLTLTDFLWGAIVAPVYSGIRIKHLMNSQVCEVYSAIMEIPLLIPVSMSLLGTFGNLAIISTDRYLAVKHYARYKFLVTRRRAVTACALVWLTTSTMATLREVGILPNVPFNLFVAGFVILSTAVIIIAQAMTLRHLRQHNNALAETMEGGNQANPNQANPVNTANAAIERKLTKTTTYVVIVLAFALIPYMCTIIATFITGKPFLKLMIPIFVPLVTLSSGINPVLYYWGNPKVKEGILKLVKCQ